MSAKNSPAKLRKPLSNRVVGHGLEKVDQLLAHPDNFRVHTAEQQNALAGAIDDIGYIHPVIVNRLTGRILDGHLRVTLALRSGVDELPVDYVELSESDEAKALLMLDPIAAMAASDKTKLDGLLRSVQSDDERVQALMSEIAEREGMDYGRPAPVDDPGAQVDRAEDLRVKWGVEGGQLWALGEHRLICGDCTDRDILARLMYEDRFTVLFTDPPYGVSIGAKNRFLNSFQPAGRNLENIQADDASAEDLMEMLVSAFSLAREFMADDCSVFVCAPQGGQLGLMMMMMMRAGLEVRHVLNWVKNQPTFSLGRLDYEYQHEPILFTWKKTHKRTKGGQFHTSVWTVDKPRASSDHPTMKPVELPENAIANHSDPGDIVGDIFLGSGTTLIACEQLGRKCRAVEISPGYCAVAIERWAVATGKTPARME